MAGPWLVDGPRIATKIRSVLSSDDPENVKWTSNPTRLCPNCQHIISNDDVNHKWPGLPGGVKFDPTDQQIILHLLAKVGVKDFKPHPFINEFIPTVNNDDGICYTHPRKLPGVSQDGGASHFFHRAIKAYTTGTRKRRKILDGDFGDVRWHKTGRTKPVMLDGVQAGCKKIMVLYVSKVRGGKAEKTHWVMHQYHLGTEEDEREGEYVASKIFYQQQPAKQGEEIELDIAEDIDAIIVKVDPVTPKSVTPEPRTEKRCYGFQARRDDDPTFLDPSLNESCSLPKLQNVGIIEDGVQPECEGIDAYCDETGLKQPSPVADDFENHAEDNPRWWDSESQNLLDSQQLVEGLSLCDELLLSQSPNRDVKAKGKPCLSDYARLGPEYLKKDLEECQNLVLDPPNVERDTPPEFRLSQLEFGSQDSFIAWGGGMI